jgi:hypothetical protein
MHSAPHSARRPRMKRAPFVTTLVAASIALAAPASAGVVLNTIDRDVSLDGAGRVVAVTGPIRCTEAERASIRVTVTQRATGAVSEGRWRGTCRRTTTTWTAKRFVRHGSAAFRPGTARACALGVTRRAGTVTDAKQWCEAVRLVQAVTKETR